MTTANEEAQIRQLIERWVSEMTPPFKASLDLEP